MITNEKEILNTKEVLELLKISRSTLYKLSSSGRIPHYKPTGGKLYFKRDQVLNWLTQEKIQTEELSITNFPNAIENAI